MIDKLLTNIVNQDVVSNRCIEGANVTADNMSVGRKDDDFRNEVDC